MVKIHNFYLRLIFYILSLIPHDLVKKKKEERSKDLANVQDIDLK